MIKSMKGLIMRQRGYGQDGFELAVTIQFDATLLRKHGLSSYMPQIKNVVLDATGVRGMPSYARPTMNQEFPRASKGVITLVVYFEISAFNASQLGANVKEYSLYHPVSLNETLEATRNDGHLFAKSVLASRIGN